MEEDLRVHRPADWTTGLTLTEPTRPLAEHKTAALPCSERLTRASEKMAFFDGGPSERRPNVNIVYFSVLLICFSSSFRYPNKNCGTILSPLQSSPRKSHQSPEPGDPSCSLSTWLPPALPSSSLTGQASSFCAWRTRLRGKSSPLKPPLLSVHPVYRGARIIFPKVIL